jgi:hypothetical protein
MYGDVQPLTHIQVTTPYACAEEWSRARGYLYRLPQVTRTTGVLVSMLVFRQFVEF